ncbi:MAG: hypothetical protein IH886_16645 [Nitrospinae bacterium]|nr:hypothetical protein [Nitrospinota bacterium]
MGLKKHIELLKEKDLPVPPKKFQSKDNDSERKPSGGLTLDLMFKHIVVQWFSFCLSRLYLRFL